ncbi:hypothetical protein Pelo_12334 [Pelomyxa schiedti]|nr:hypothetical protein Pelo_12334 [Pelomyxa schiedti]
MSEEGGKQPQDPESPEHDKPVVVTLRRSPRMSTRLKTSTSMAARAKQRRSSVGVKKGKSEKVANVKQTKDVIETAEAEGEKKEEEATGEGGTDETEAKSLPSSKVKENAQDSAQLSVSMSASETSDDSPKKASDSPEKELPGTAQKKGKRKKRKGTTPRRTTLSKNPDLTGSEVPQLTEAPETCDTEPSKSLPPPLSPPSSPRHLPHTRQRQPSLVEEAVPPTTKRRRTGAIPPPPVFDTDEASENTPPPSPQSDLPSTPSRHFRAQRGRVPSPTRYHSPSPPRLLSPSPPSSPPTGTVNEKYSSTSPPNSSEKSNSSTTSEEESDSPRTPKKSKVTHTPKSAPAKGHCSTTSSSTLPATPVTPIKSALSPGRGLSTRPQSAGRKVKFSHVEVRNYRRKHGGSCGVPTSGSFPLGLDWAWDDTVRRTVAQYERERKPFRRDTNHLEPLTENQRRSVLLAHGEGPSEEIAQQLKTLRHNREISIRCKCTRPCSTLCPCVKAGIPCVVYCLCQVCANPNNPPPAEPPPPPPPPPRPSRSRRVLRSRK